MPEMTDDLECKIALASAELLKSILTLTRTRHAEDAELCAEIDALKACRLTVSAVGADLQLELVGPVAAGMKRFYGATFAEQARVLQ